MEQGQHCCADMSRNVDTRCSQHPEPFDCPDNLINFSAKFREYGLIIHDGGNSAIDIAFCPWCGNRLPESQRDRWFNELEQQGIDPWGDDIPAKYEDGSWLKH